MSRVVLFGVLGTVTTVLVSGGILLKNGLGSHRSYSWTSRAEQPGWEVVFIEARLGYTELMGSPDSFRSNWEDLPPEHPLPRWSVFQLSETRRRGQDISLVREVAVGWPCRAFHSALASVGRPRSSTPPFQDYQETRGRTVRIAQVDYPDVLVPVTPSIPGFAANSAIYGLAWFGLLFGVGRLKRWRRRRRGLCAFCKYDLSGVDGNTCPECGKVAR